MNRSYPFLNSVRREGELIFTYPLSNGGAGVELLREGDRLEQHSGRFHDRGRTVWDNSTAVRLRYTRLP
jgi:hypothetical protein